MERMRRLRVNEAIRSMVRENTLHVEELIYPLFIIEGNNICNPVESMPNVFQYSIDRLKDLRQGIRCRYKSSIIIWYSGT